MQFNNAAPSVPFSIGAAGSLGGIQGALERELHDIERRVSRFDPASLMWPWRHDDARVDRLQTAVMHIVKTAGAASRAETFFAISRAARELAGVTAPAAPVHRAPPVPYVTEPWYCCAEPMESV